jgi:hypothetical protein
MGEVEETMVMERQTRESEGSTSGGENGKRWERVCEGRCDEARASRLRKVTQQLREWRRLLCNR